jgi:hypothetical protein
MTDIVYKPVSRVLTRTEMKFFSYVLDEREACALARVCHLKPDATYQEIEDAVLKCFTDALEASGLRDSIEYVNGTNFKHRREMQ